MQGFVRKDGDAFRIEGGELLKEGGPPFGVQFVVEGKDVVLVRLFVLLTETLQFVLSRLFCRRVLGWGAQMQLLKHTVDDVGGHFGLMFTISRTVQFEREERSFSAITSEKGRDRQKSTVTALEGEDSCLVEPRQVVGSAGLGVG